MYFPIRVNGLIMQRYKKISEKINATDHIAGENITTLSNIKISRGRYFFYTNKKRSLGMNWMRNYFLKSHTGEKNQETSDGYCYYRLQKDTQIEE